MYKEISEKLEQYLLLKGKEYLNIIKNDYSSFMNEEQKDLLDSLLNSNFIKVEENSNKLKELWQNKNFSIPLAHGGRTFEDNIIHFYPFDYLERMNKKEIITNDSETIFNYLSKQCEIVLIHELFHYFIRPTYSTNANFQEYNSYTTEGLVDLITRDFQIRNNINNNYSSEYYQNVIFLRQILNNINSYEDKMKLIFQGSIEKIYYDTNTNPTEISQYINKDLDNLLSEIVNIVTTSYPHSKETITRALYNLYANYDKEEDFFNTLLKITKETFPNLFQEISENINNYTNNLTI